MVVAINCFLKPVDQILYFSSLPPSRGPDPDRLFSVLSKIDDWDRLLKKALLHRLPLRLYSLLKRYRAAAFLGPEKWGKIESFYLESQAYVMAHEAELARLLPQFNLAGIEVLLLKGAALLQTVYSSHPVRFLVDLDLLVHKKDFLQAETLFRKLGYQPKPIRSHLPSAWHDRELGLQLRRRTSTWIHPEKDVKIDLHEEVFEELSFFQLDPDWMWQDKRPLSINGHRVFLPSPTNLFMHLLLHLVKHARMWENSLGWYLDLDKCLRHFRKAIDGNTCLKIFRKNQGAEKALEILAFLEAHFSTPLPQEIKSLLQEKNIQPLSLKAVFFFPQNLAGVTSSRFGWTDPAELFVFYWNRMEGFGKKICFLVRWIFPDQHYLKAKYPFRSPLEKLLAYLKHFVAMVHKGMIVLFHLFRPNRLDSHYKNEYTSPLRS